MSEAVVEKWKAYFWEEPAEDEEDNRMEVDGEEGAPGAGVPDKPPIDPQIRWRPFASELDWRVAMWAVREDVSQGALNRLLAIPGVVERLELSFKNVRELFGKVDNIPDRAKWKTATLSFPETPDEEHTVHFRDILEAIQALLGNPTHTKHIVYRPRRVFSDHTRNNQVYSEMWTGLWWNAIQECLPAGATVAPVILATDKTQLTQFSGNKSAYPVYLTLGNIPRAIRRKPSEHACILLGYLPSAKLSKTLPQKERKARQQRLFHEAMCIIVQPLVKAGRQGVHMTSGDGCVCKVYPILATYVADYPEQCLVTCSKYGTCPKCNCPADMLGSLELSEPRIQSKTKDIIDDAWEQVDSAGAAEAITMPKLVSGGVKKPFWSDLHLTNIHLSITPDVLHQLYQGVFKHLVSWSQDLLGADELDRRIRCLPPAYGVCHFRNGISTLSQISGSERKHMARALLACLVGKISKETMLVYRSLLDFIYLAQYPMHDETTLKYMEDALKMFHTNKDVLVKLKIREHLNIPKFHSLLHYVSSIRQFGTTDNYNTEMFECLHIDFAKDAWRATNHRNELPQMVKWISRQEKMAMFEVWQKEQQVEANQSLDVDDTEDGITEHDEPPDKHAPELVNIGNSVRMAKYSPAPQQHLARIQERHKSSGFTTTLAQFINGLQPEEVRLTRANISTTWLPFDSLDVYHKFHLKPSSLSDGKEEDDIVKAIPAGSRPGGKDCFDTVIVLDNEQAEATGVQGE
ncbi:hypothetical protein FOMPIDRAFT_1050476 [Fomitopsis schrenkii]|uniref:Uncharacterized protein n=1 Tax=Fomitopsis schrenkii TaxID=2126942 RepID=S8FN17_FOMSC|nr:hypothetical protein FOMPIDRAFT_1050476 [Fomitopsis schrenkii]